MAILITCTCGKLQHVPNSYEGRIVRCLYCEQAIPVVLDQEDFLQKPEEPCTEMETHDA